MTLKVKPK